jgi:CRP-like cAMP-binding protein
MSDNDSGALGKVYDDGDVIIRQGEMGDCMFVIQEGAVEVYTEKEGKVVLLAVRREGELIGEMAVFEREVRSASVRARGRARVLTLDKKNFLRRINEDPSLALRLVQTMSRRIRELSEEVARLQTQEPSSRLTPDGKRQD